jgi:hypothetical protein
LFTYGKGNNKKIKLNSDKYDTRTDYKDYLI